MNCSAASGTRAAGIGCLAVVVVFLVACGDKPPAKKAEPPPVVAKEPDVAAEYRAAADAFFDGYMERSPDYAVSLGLHEYDGKLPDVSAVAINDHIAWLEKQLAVFTAVDASKLSPIDRIELETAIAHIRGDLFQLSVRKQPFSDPMFYPNLLDLTPYVSRDYADLAERARGVIGVCSGSSELLKRAAENLPEAMPRTWIETALLQTRGMIQFAGDDVANVFAEIEDPDQAREMGEALLNYSSALSGYAELLESRLASATDDFAIGEQAFVRMVADTEGLDIDLARLEKVAKDDLFINSGKLEIAARKLHKRRPIPVLVKRAMRDKPRPDQLIEVTSKQADEMRQLLVDKDLVSIPSEDVAEVRHTPPFMRWNFAFLSSPGPFEDKPLPAFYYITPPDSKWPRREQRDYVRSVWDLLFVTVHEVWPGHFLQSLHARQVDSRILKSFCSYAMSEGWAHYTEEMMREAGAGGDDPRADIGMLTNALLRNVRFVAAIGMHTGNMTVDQAHAMFESKAYLSKAEARQQAVRGTFDPGYINYTLGKLMIVKLRKDYQAKVGEEFSLKKFHDEFLSYGCAPIPVIRRAMLGPDAGPAL